MKRLLALLGLITLTAGFALGQRTQAFTLTYDGPSGSNDYANTVLESVSGVTTEKTTAAESSATNDVTLYKTTGSAIYIGYAAPFDGFTGNVYTSASGGMYSIQYWNGSSWAFIVEKEDADIKNGVGSNFSVDWDRPSNWTAKQMTMSTAEDGSTGEKTDSLYFIKFMVVDTSYTNSATFSQIGIMNYNVVVNIEDELGNGLDETLEREFDSSSYEISKDDGNGTYYYGFYTPTVTTYNYDFFIEGYVEQSGDIRVTQTQQELNLEMDYTHKIIAEDSSTGATVNISTAYAGTHDTLCTISSGIAYCPVPTTEDGDTATVSASGYESKTVSIPNRTGDDDDQEVTTLTLTQTTHGIGADIFDLTVDDIYFSGNSLYAEISNEGSTDVESSNDVYIAVYVDGDREYVDDYPYYYFEAGETNTYSFLEDTFDDGESYDVEVCVDYYDNVSEDDEADNCRSETLTVGSTSSDKPDLDVTDIYLDGSDLYFTVTNKGDADVDSGDSVKMKVYVDGDSEYSKSVTQSSSTTNFLDEGEEDDYNAGEILADEGSTYEVEVCVDTDDNVDEESESNNCMTVDEDSIGSKKTTSDTSCGNFTDLDGEWSEEYVCDLYDRDVVSGRTSTRFYPDSSVTRAEFLKMALLNADLSPYSVSSQHYSDVSSSDWYYSYVTYASSKGYVEGYTDGSFKPNNYVTRGEALVILMRIAKEELYGVDNSDIDFWDVDENDFFAYAVVLASNANLIDGYSDGSFRPNNSITRGEAAKILDLAYDEYFN